MNSRQRVWFLDEARGLSILLMVLHHGAYDAAFLLGWPLDFLSAGWFGIIRTFFVGVFCADFRLRLPVFPQQSAPGRTVPFTGGRAVRHHRFSDPRPADPFWHFAPAGLRHAAFCLFTTAAGPDSPRFRRRCGLVSFFLLFFGPQRTAGLRSHANTASPLSVSKRLYRGAGISRAGLLFRRLLPADSVAVSFLGGRLRGGLAASGQRAGLAVPAPQPVSCGGRSKIPLDLSCPSAGALSDFSADPPVFLTLQIVCCGVL